MSVDVDMEETAADRAFQPQRGCCEDCDEAVDETEAQDADPAGGQAAE